MEQEINFDRGCLRVAPPRSVRASMAQWWLSDGRSPVTSSDDATLGEITLRPHQSSAVRRLSAAIAEFGGALLCDEVGTGKTFVALAVTRKAQRVLVVAPASLSEMWHRAAEQTLVPIVFTSFERLSRNSGTPLDFDFLVVDEAHHARNPSTARYQALSRLASSAPTLLLSATPVHNRRADLAALLALFLGSHSDSLSEDSRSRCIIRRGNLSAGNRDGMPRVEPAEWCHISHDETLPVRLLALPPALPPRYGGDGGVLVVRSLLRQWASSDAALAGGLKRRMQKTGALIAALESGVYPSASELAAWAGGDDSMQLAFPQIVAPAFDAPSELLAVAAEHYCALRQICCDRVAACARDQERAAVLDRIVKANDGVKIVAFSQYSETVIGLFKALRSRREAAALTARGAMVAGGIVSRTEALDRFAPRARGIRVPRAADTISLLLTTDLLSEGVNLQDAGVVVHLDLPWTPARLEQRMGRIVRFGSEHESVRSYALKPPASAEYLLRIEQIIEEKISLARAVVGDVPPVLPGSTVARASPSHASPHDSLSPPLLGDSIRRVMADWTERPGALEQVLPAKAESPRGVPLVAAVAAATDGFLAACCLEGRTVLLSSMSGRATNELHHAWQTAIQSGGAAVPISRRVLCDALVELHSYFHECAATREITPEMVSVSRARRDLLRRISAVARSARPHLRAQTAAIAQRARSVALARYGVATEAALCRLALLESGNDDEWLESIVEFGVDNPPIRTSRSPDPTGIVALILLQHDPDW